MSKFILCLFLLCSNCLIGAEADYAAVTSKLRVTASPIFVKGEIVSCLVQLDNLNVETPYVVRVQRQLFLNFSITARDEGVNLVKPQIASAIQYNDAYGYHYDSVVPPFSSIIYEVPMPSSVRSNYSKKEAAKILLNVNFLYQEGIEIGQSPIKYVKEFELLGVLGID